MRAAGGQEALAGGVPADCCWVTCGWSLLAGSLCCSLKLPGCQRSHYCQHGAVVVRPPHSEAAGGRARAPLQPASATQQQPAPRPATHDLTLPAALPHQRAHSLYRPRRMSAGPGTYNHSLSSNRGCHYLNSTVSLLETHCQPSQAGCKTLFIFPQICQPRHKAAEAAARGAPVLCPWVCPCAAQCPGGDHAATQGAAGGRCRCRSPSQPPPATRRCGVLLWPRPPACHHQITRF